MNAADDDGIKLLCRCLAGISMADGDLDGREIATQMSIVEQITGRSVSADDIVALTIDMGADSSMDMNNWEGFCESLFRLRPMIIEDFRAQILRACILVGRADDTMKDLEVERIYDVAQALGFTRVDVDAQFKVIR